MWWEQLLPIILFFNSNGESIKMSQSLRLSYRLETVAKYIQKNSFLADIGSDHAYLPVYCIQTQKARQAIAGEVTKGPYDSAKKTVCQYKLSDRIDVRLGNGFDVILGEAVECVTICGMGGQLIRDILEHGKEKIPTVQRLVLQPNVAAYTIRKWAVQNGWKLTAEEILKEDHKIYEILVLERTFKEMDATLDAKDLLFGSFLRKEKNEVFQEKWYRELKKLSYVKKSLENAPQTTENMRRLQEVVEEYQQIERILSK